MARKSVHRRKKSRVGGVGGGRRKSTDPPPSSSDDGETEEEDDESTTNRRGVGVGFPLGVACVPFLLLTIAALYRRSFGDEGEGGGSRDVPPRGGGGGATTTVVEEEETENRIVVPVRGTEGEEEADVSASAPAASAAFTVHEGCTLYYAPSTPPNAGLGVYTTKSVPPSSNIGEPDVLINLFDMKLSEAIDHAYDYGERFRLSEASDVESVVPGLASLCNAHSVLSNVRLVGFRHGGSNEDRSSPGVGSFTLYRGVEHRSTTTIEAGSELLHDYGDTDRYFDERRGRLGDVPLRRHWEEADRIVSTFLRFVSTQRGNGKSASGPDDDEWIRDLWLLLRRDGRYGPAASANARAKEIILKRGPAVRSLLVECRYDDPRIAKALPRTVDDLETASRVGSARVAFLNGSSVRPISWIRNNGRCVDHLRPGPSAIIAGAGQLGAFAKRDLPKDGIVVSSPVFHIVNVSVLDSFEVEKKDDGIFKPGNRRSSKQLLLNYCLGHRNSTLVLFPYGPVANLINHASGREGEGGDDDGVARRPNVEVRWSDHPRHRSEWLNLSVEELVDRPQGGLQIDYVATRHIEAGDEIFFDYGRRWEDAWREHVRGWSKPPPGPTGYKSAERWNREGAPIPTERERRPDNVRIGCYYEGGGSDGDNEAKEGGGAAADVRWTEPSTWSDDEKRFRPCKVLRRYLGPAGHGGGSEVLYDAAIDDRRGGKLPLDRTTAVVVRGMPRKALKFVDVPYTSDQHSPKAFRHVIEPDGTFPDAWKNV